MTFYLLLALINVVCFLPLYALNFRERPNPFEFLTEQSAFNDSRLRWFYAKYGLTDPFRINFDFTFAMLVIAAAGNAPRWLAYPAALVLGFGFIEILYTAVMGSVFKRAPVLTSDLSLLGTGLVIADRQVLWILPAAGLALMALAVAACFASLSLMDSLPEGTWLPALGAVLLLPPCLYHWWAYPYAMYLSRTVYSPTLHLIRNLDFERQVRRVAAKAAEKLPRYKEFQHVALRDAPSIVLICVESYGRIVYDNERLGQSIGTLMDKHQASLARHGYRFASSYSEAPIFAGGSWLSYVSFTHGFALRDIKLYEALFGLGDPLVSYESLFHVLKRNDYASYVLCPLGGIDPRSFDWSIIERCFRSDRYFDWSSLDYHGPCFEFFGKGLRMAPDQYSLNHAYEAVRRRGQRPFSLFFCTLNSHYPWDVRLRVVSDWRSLGDPRLSPERGESSMPMEERYRAAIEYQLDYLLHFAAERAGDDLLFVLFGDHQPPIITPERAGKETPVHVIAKNAALIDAFLEQGFVAALNPTGRTPTSIRHEAFLSLFLKGMQEAYGVDRSVRIEFRPRGLPVFDGL